MTNQFWGRPHAFGCFLSALMHVKGSAARFIRAHISDIMQGAQDVNINLQPSHQALHHLCTARIAQFGSSTI